MRIAIMGTGAVGGLYGYRLLKQGHDVLFVARGRTLDVLGSDGLTVIEPDGSRETVPVTATDGASLADHEPVDLALMCVKAWQVRESAALLRPVLRGGEHDADTGWATGVATMQNGVEAPGDVAEVLGDAHAVAGTTKVLCELEAPGVVRRVDFDPRVSLGERDNTPTPRVRALAEALTAGGVETTVAPDIDRALWEKFCFLVSYGGVCAVTRFPIGVVRTIPESRAMLDGAVREIQAVGRALGVDLDLGTPDHILDFLDSVPEDTTSSMMRDLLAGRPSELEHQNGAVCRLGRRAGVPTPTHDFIYAAMKPGELRARGQLGVDRYA
ncbi:MAG: 2-dehydropantoate 2-reductase [Phycisphaerales bacterium JB040]